MSHLGTSVEVYQQKAGVNNLMQSPGIFYVTALLYKLFSVNEYVAISTNLLFLILLLISTYVITYYFSKSIFTSSYATILVCLYPMTYGLSRFYLTELALMASVSFCFAMFILSNNFKHQIYSLLFGLIIGIGFPSTFTSIGSLIFCPKKKITLWFSEHSFCNSSTETILHPASMTITAKQMTPYFIFFTVTSGKKITYPD